MSEARYAVGIDLGTTHCVMAAVDLTASDRDEVVEGIEPIPQLTGPGAVEDRLMLPSFLYLPHPDELRAEDRILPWGEPSPFVVGELARAMGGRTSFEPAAPMGLDPGRDELVFYSLIYWPIATDRPMPSDAALRAIDQKAYSTAPSASSLSRASFSTQGV